MTIRLKDGWLAASLAQARRDWEALPQWAKELDDAILRGRSRPSWEDALDDQARL